MFANALPLLINQAIAEQRIDREAGLGYPQAFGEFVAELKSQVAPAVARDWCTYERLPHVRADLARRFADMRPHGAPAQNDFLATFVAYVFLAVGDPEHEYHCEYVGISDDGLFWYKFHRMPINP